MRWSRRGCRQAGSPSLSLQQCERIPRQTGSTGLGRLALKRKLRQEVDRGCAGCGTGNDMVGSNPDGLAPSLGRNTGAPFVTCHLAPLACPFMRVEAFLSHCSSFPESDLRERWLDLQQAVPSRGSLLCLFYLCACLGLPQFWGNGMT